MYARHESEPDSRPPPVSFSPPNAPPISAPLVPMFTLAIPQSDPSCDRNRSALERNESVKIALESPCVDPVVDDPSPPARFGDLVDVQDRRERLVLGDLRATLRFGTRTMVGSTKCPGVAVETRRSRPSEPAAAGSSQPSAVACSMAAHASHPPTALIDQRTHQRGRHRGDHRSAPCWYAATRPFRHLSRRRPQWHRTDAASSCIAGPPFRRRRRGCRGRRDR